MLKIYYTADSRYKVDRRFVLSYIQKSWLEREMPSGVLSVAFVGSRKGRQLAKEYLKDDIEHPVITFPLVTREGHFEVQNDETLLGEIVICYPQVALYAADKNREINKIIEQFLDHAISVLKQNLGSIV